MRQLVDFLNHGFLPFVGREQEMGRIARFWEGTAESHGLRTALMIGEAGSGKSRFVEEIVPVILRSGGLVVHAKLYPESTTALAPLLAKGLWRATEASGLIQSEPEGTLASVIGAFRRLCRLRQTILVLEDIHLLSRQSLGDLATFLEGISDEPLSVFCASRPTELAIHGVLERYLVEEIHLGGLDPVEIAILWSQLFASEPQDKIIPLLSAATTGNILAIRSALRGAIKSGTLGTDARNQQWHMMVPANTFAEALQQSVLLLSKGMAAHLNDTEHQSAVELARLGEIFSHEAACQILSDGERALEILLFKGIIRASTTMAPALPGPVSARPLLCFSHTLLHRYFLQERSSDAAAVIRLIAAGAPLYSTLPFQLIEASTARSASTPAEQQQAADRSIGTMMALHGSPDWELGVRLSEAVGALLETCMPLWNDERSRQIRLRFLDARLMLLGRTHDERFVRLCDEYLQETESPGISSLLPHRLSALSHKVGVVGRIAYEKALPYNEEAERLVLEHPWLATTGAYLQYLRTMVIVARAVNDVQMIHSIERRAGEILANPEIDEAARLHVRSSILIYFLDIFETEEELAARLRMLNDLESMQGSAGLMLPWHRSILLYEMGKARQVVPHLNEVMPRLRDHGLRRSLYQSRMLLLCARTVIGDPIEAIESELRSILLDAPLEFRQMLCVTICSHLLEATLLRGERQWCARIFNEFAPVARRIFPDFRIVRQIAVGEFSELQPGDMMHSELQRMVQAYLQDPQDREEITAAALGVLQAPVIRFESVTVIRATLELIARLDRSHQGLASELCRAVTEAINRAITWLLDRALFLCAQCLLDDFNALADPDQPEKWQVEISNRQREYHKSSQVVHSGARMKLSMLGTIQIVGLGEKTIRPRGVRLRTLLGLMVADRMLDKPLTSREFYLLAAGEDNIDRARNTIHVAMHRLRESVGQDDAFTAVEKPRLNLDLFEVDLLEARRLLRESDAAARTGAWLRASTALLATLKLTGNDVPFPSLYDTFFEAAREDFENELRDTVLRVSRGLLEEDDPSRAEEILTAAFESIHDDEELAALLQTSLTRLGRRAEAERVRMRSGEASGDQV